MSFKVEWIFDVTLHDKKHLAYLADLGVLAVKKSREGSRSKSKGNNKPVDTASARY